MEMSISRQDAHLKLLEFRDAIFRTPGHKLVDVTAMKAFDWQSYICQRSDCMQIIQGGITTFHCEVWRYILDPNDGYVGQANFVVSYSNGTAARLHPHQHEDAQVICGVLDDWRESRPPGKRRSEPALLQQEDTLSQFDPLGECDAMRALQKLTECFPQCRSHVGAFIDISDGDKPDIQPFQWWRWILNREDCDAIIGPGISAMHLLWVPDWWLRTAAMKEGWHYVATRVDTSIAIVHPTPRRCHCGCNSWAQPGGKENNMEILHPPEKRVCDD